MSEGAVAAETKEGPVGLSGWLILPMLGLFAAPIFGLTQLGTYGQVSENWPYLTYAQAATVLIELAFNVLLVLLAPITLLFFMFKRLEIFPGWYMIWLGVVPVFLIADPILIYAMFPEAFLGGLGDAFDKETTQGITRSIIGAAIWIPYMMRSERVANTFVK